MKRINGKLKAPNPVFHLHNKSEDQSVLSTAILRHAKKSGKLNLSNKCLISIPDEVFSLGDVHSDDGEVNLDGNKNKDSSKWWELEPLNYLDISSNSIKEIPPKINQLDNLVTLILQHNNLGSVPPELGNLRKLLKLDLAHNKISYLPNDLIGLKELKSLNLSNNIFEKFPECVYDLVMLNNLDLSHNQVYEIPPGIGFLIRLFDLNASFNKLVSIAPDISNCRALLHLNLSNNEITTEGLPHLGELHNVQTIHLQYNKLTLLPKINGCSSLKEIHLGYNKMEEITIEELSTLSHLQIINLRDNKISKLPKEMSCLQNLIRLDLTNNNLKELPATLSLLPHLENLQIEGNGLRTIRRDIITGGTQRLLKYLKQTLPVSEEDKKLVAQLPCHSENGFPDRFSMRSSKSLNVSSKGLCNIPNEVFEEALQVPCNMIDLSKNKLMEVPSGMWKLSIHLTDLNLSQNQLKELPGEIGKLINLTYLNLETNQLTTLPKELSECCKLREININYNKFEDIPNCVSELKSLEILLARDNKIVQIDAEGLLKLKFLATLELSNNNISTVPPKLGNMTQLRSLGLDGNGLRNPRSAILAKGTEAVLSWLRDKIV